MNTTPDETGSTSECLPPAIISEEFQGHVQHRPEVPVEVCGVSGSALLDFGASISAISEEFFSKIRILSLAPKFLSTLPVIEVTISTAVRGRSKTITKQVFMPLIVFGKDEEFSSWYHTLPPLSFSEMTGCPNTGLFWITLRSVSNSLNGEKNVYSEVMMEKCQL